MMQLKYNSLGRTADAWAEWKLRAQGQGEKKKKKPLEWKRNHLPEK